MVEGAVTAYRKACESRKKPAIIMAYRIMWRHFHDPGAYPALTDAYLAWTGKPVPAAPKQTVVIGGRRLLPWTVALCKQPPWPSDLPSHAVPVSVVELAYLEMCPSDVRWDLNEEVIKQWQRAHFPPSVESTLKWFRESEWEVVQIKADDGFEWRAPEKIVSKFESRDKAEGKRRKPKQEALGLDEP